ncbi:MAG: internalin, putative [uncultured Aureispira sp.]|uniref:Internalin, putative n=1 Tax=uncultured Aureispira sp. TaxID=1331704 RepID=A0A6S6U758_9BACT|nr:MAG: internalin, putative [uncultured Aureispira sp.]
MKQLYSIIALCCLSFCWFNQANAQATSCSDAFQSPFCSGIAQYAANFDGTGSGSGPQAPAGPNYDCLGTQGNPSYFSLAIEQTGIIDFTLDNTANTDIDFILWGPFSSVAAANLACDSMGQGNQWGDVADCSYSVLGQEQVNIPAAQAGEIYILMVTNYSNVSTDIFSTQNLGSGNIACPCEIPYTIDTISPVAGSQAYLTDTTNGINQFVVCPNELLSIKIGASGALNDTLSLYGPFTTVNDVFPTNSVLAVNPNAPTNYDSIAVFTLITPTSEEIGVNNFSMGLRNDLNTGGFSDSSCFDLINIQVVVPGVNLSDRNVCSGATFSVIADSIPSTTVGSSTYSWSQISGPVVTFSSTTTRTPMITVPITSSTSSNDSTIIVVDYNYGALCPMSDTMVLYYPDMSIAATALPDSVCAGYTTDLLVSLSDTLTPAVCDDYDVAIIPFAPLATTGGTAVTAFAATSIFSATDEGVSAALPVGFDFNFYCTNFDSFYIHTNGFITFNGLGPNSGFMPGATLPAAGDPNNIIALGWEDLDISNGGSINYYIVGTAPNRQLVVNFNGIQNWAGLTSVTSQAILNESDNSIEIHITENTLPFSTIGIENGNGTLAHYHSSLNPTQGQALGPTTNLAYRFSPKVFGPFYTWTPAATLSANDVVAPVATPTAATTYSVLVEDGICTYSDSVAIRMLSGLNTPVVTCDSSSFNSISFSWSDLGLPLTGFYQYSLDSGITWINAGTSLATTATGLMNNTSYTVFVRADDGTAGTCPLSPIGTTNCSTLNYSCTNNPAINIVLTPSNLLCNNDASGCVNAVVTGGSGSPMNLAWSTGAMDMDSICNLSAGTYTLVVTDTVSIGAGSPPISCIDSQSITITEPTALVITLDSFNNPSCTGYTDGAIFTSTLGGTPGYTYNWSNGDSTATISTISDGGFTVTVTDLNGCSVIGGPYSLAAATGVTASITTLIGNLSCDLQAIGALSAVATGGNNLTYSWSNGSTDSTISGLAAGTYTVTVTSSNGCTDTVSQTINAPIIPNLDAFVSVTGMTSVSVPLNTSVTLSAGSTGFDYNWTSIANPLTGNANIANTLLSTTSANPDPEGSYTYVVTASATTNDTTCSVTDTVWVTVEAPYQGMPSAFTPDGDGINDTFRPVMLTNDEVSTFIIYNRWGQIVYNGSEAHGNGWDGTFKGVAQPTGAYIYTIVYQKASDPEPRSIKGQLTLIR